MGSRAPLTRPCPRLQAADAVGGEPLERVKEALDGWVHALDDECAAASAVAATTATSDSNAPAPPRYAFWMSQRKVEVRTEGNGDGGSRRTHVLNRFDAPTVTAPRPESYGADIEVANEARASVDLPPVSRRENLGHKLYRCAGEMGQGGRWTPSWEGIAPLTVHPPLPFPQQHCGRVRVRVGL